MILLKIYLVGLVILLAAVGLNLLAGWVGLSTWYDVLKAGGEQGFARVLRDTSILNWIFLALLYPFLLGAAAYLVLR
jgi:hypothetical protein